MMLGCLLPPPLLQLLLALPPAHVADRPLLEIKAIMN